MFIFAGLAAIFKAISKWRGQDKNGAADGARAVAPQAESRSS